MTLPAKRQKPASGILPGTERWEKLLEAIKAVPLGALAEDIRLRDATRVALLGLINALAAFGEGEKFQDRAVATSRAAKS